MTKTFLLIVARDVRLASRQGSAAISVAVFFVLAVTLFPLGIGPDENLLSHVSVAVIWVAALLSAVLSLDRVFQPDYEDGNLDLLSLSELPLEGLALAKAAGHWLTTGLLIVILSPLLGLVMHLRADGYLTLVLAMLLGTPTLSLIGTIAAALTVGIRRGGVLLSLLVLPLYIPVLVFGVAAVEAAIKQTSAQAPLLILTAMMLFTLVISPIASAAALRLNLE